MNNSYVLIWIENKLASFTERERESFIDTCKRNARTIACPEKNGEEREREQKRMVYTACNRIQLPY